MNGRETVEQIEALRDDILGARWPENGERITSLSSKTAAIIAGELLDKGWIRSGLETER